MLLSKFTLPAGTDLDIDATKHKKIYLDADNKTLTADVSVNITGIPYEGLHIKLLYTNSSGVAVANNQLVIFGENVTDLATQDMQFEALYINSGWKVIGSNLSLPSDLDNFEIADFSVTNGKLANFSVSPIKVLPSLKTQTFYVEIDCSTAERNTIKRLWVEQKYKITKVGYTVITPMVTDSLTVNFGVGQGIGEIAHTTVVPTSAIAGSTSIVAVDTADIESPDAGSSMIVAPAKTTAGGKIGFTITIERVEND